VLFLYLSSGHKKTPDLPGFASSRDLPQLLKMAGTGFEIPQKSTGNPTSEDQSGAKCGALSEGIGPIDPELAELAQAWPNLPLA
jgi:hypothetical protein